MPQPSVPSAAVPQPAGPIPVATVAPSDPPEECVTGTVVVDQHAKNVAAIHSLFRHSPAIISGGSCFRVVSHIADGTWSCVYQVLREEEGQFRAMKVIPLGAANAEGYQAEVETLRRLRHPHIVKYYGHFVQRFNSVKCLCIELEFCPKRTLFDYIRTKRWWRGQLTAENILTFTTQLVSALKYLHAQGRLHGCVIPKTILMSGDNQLKLTSFSSPLWIERHRDIVTCERLYAPPECPDSGVPYCPPQPSYDMWSLGCVVSVLVTFKFLGQDRHCTSPMAANPALCQGVLNEVADQHNGLFAPLCAKLLEMDCVERLTADEAHVQISHLLCKTRKPDGLASPRGAFRWFSSLRGGSRSENHN